LRRLYYKVNGKAKVYPEKDDVLLLPLVVSFDWKSENIIKRSIRNNTLVGKEQDWRLLHSYIFGKEYNKPLNLILKDIENFYKRKGGK